MDTKKKMGLLMGAMVVSMHLGAGPSQALPTEADRAQVVSLYQSGNFEGVIAFLQANPQALEGDSSFARYMSLFYALWLSGRTTQATQFMDPQIALLDIFEPRFEGIEGDGNLIFDRDVVGPYSG
jgi:hypothetical protein